MKSEDKGSFHFNESQESTLTPVSTMNATQYGWGEGCKAWFLLKNPTLTVIQEEMPPGTSERLHLHHKVQQLFYILRGEATMEIGDESIELKPFQSSFYFNADRSLRALLTTDNELKLIAAPAIIGFSRSPKTG